MPIFEYKALDEDSRVLKGTIDSPTLREARAHLRERGIYPTLLRPKPESFSIFSRISLQDLSIFTRQISTLLTAGLPISQALNAVVEQTESRKLKKVLSEVESKLREGSSFSECLSLHPHVFNDIYINLVRAGESSGALELVLARLADFLENQITLKSRVRASLAYPVFMVIVGTGVVFFLLTYIVPTVTKIFSDLGQKLPLLTQILIVVGGFMKNFWWVIILAGVAAWTGFKYYAKTKSGRLYIDGLKLNLPLFGGLVRKLAMARFARTLATLYSGGIPILTALDIVKEVLNNQVLSQALVVAGKEIGEGEDIATPLKRSGVFPPMMTHMISVGEQSGNLDEMLLKAAEAYENEVDTTVRTLTSILEPVLIVGMGVVVGFIVVAILLPIFQMNLLIR